MASIRGTSNPDILVGTTEDDLIRGFGGHDTLVGDTGDDRLHGNDGDDLLAGGDGDDLLVGGDGDDTLAGGNGIDTATFAAATGGVTVDLGGGTAQGQGTDVLLHVERIIGSTFADRLIGGAGNESLFGDHGNDTLEGGGGNDHLVGGPGRDLLIGGAGDDTLDGRLGTDIASFATAAGAVTVDLGLGTATGEGNDVLIDIEHVIGSGFSDLLTGGGGGDRLFGGIRRDTLAGGAGDDMLHGGNGADSISGEDGDDRLVGGNGDDTLTGGSGNDTLDGRAGFDVARFEGSRGGYVLIRNGDGSRTVVDADGSNGDDGTDLLRRIDLLRFDDIELGSIGSRHGLGDVVQGAVPGLAGVRFVGAGESDRASRISFAGDVNGDGITDLIVGAPFNDEGGDDSGTAYLIFGGQDFASLASNGTIDLGTVGQPGGPAGLRFTGDMVDDSAGNSVAFAGDINGDGIADLIIGAYSVDGNGVDSGSAFVIFGGQDLAATALDGRIDLGLVGQAGGLAGFQLIGEAVNDHAGRAVASAGDINGDGVDDLIVGAPLTGSGQAYVVFGGQDFSALVHPDGGIALSLVGQSGGPAGFQLTGSSSFAQTGVSVSSAGDVNGDGIGDLIVGASYDDASGTTAGAAYVVFGGQDFAALTNPAGEIGLATIGQAGGLAGFRLAGENIGAYTGFTVSAGDVNGDGIADVIVGAPFLETADDGRGAVYVMFGGQDFATIAGPDGTIDLGSVGTSGGPAGFQLIRTADEDLAGFSASSAGDVNGDGIDDLIVGAPASNQAGFSSGASYVVFGGQDFAALANGDGDIDLANIGQDGGLAGFQVTGASASDLAGYSVSGAGDLNGDGLADLTIGALRNADAPQDSGVSYVIYGGDFSDSINQFGSDLDDLLQGTGADESLIGGLGNDTLVGGGGRDVLYGGAGDDVLAISDGSFVRLDGGGGQDTLRLDGGVNLHLTDIANTAIRDIEAIDMDNGAENLLALDPVDVFDFSSTPNADHDTSHNSLVIHGDANDVLMLHELPPGHPSGAGEWSSAGTTDIGGETFLVFDYALLGDVLASVAVSEVVGVIVVA